MLWMHDQDEATGESVVRIEAWSLDRRRYRMVTDCEYDAAIALAEALGVSLWDGPPIRG